MKKELLYLAFLGIFMSKISNAQNVFLKGEFVEIGVHPAGSFGSSTAAPSGYHSNAPGNRLGFVCDINKDGWNNGVPKLMGDYFVPGLPEEGWGMQWFSNASGTVKTDFYNFGLMDAHEVSTVSHQKIKTKGREQSQWIGNASKSGRSALVYQTVTLDSLAQYFTINVLIKNTSTDTLYDLGYFRNVDPDNEQLLKGRYDTYNYIQHQPGWWGNVDKAAVVAYGAAYKSPCILGAIDKRAHVSIGGFSVRDINDVFNYKDTTQTQANPHYRDEAISIAFDLGNIAPGKCVALSYYYALQNINPEDITFPVNTQFDISDDGFNTSQSFLGGNLCVRDTVLNFAVKTNGMGSSFIDKVYWDANLDGSYELEGDTVQITFNGWQKHKFSQRIIFCDGSKLDSTYELFIEPKPIIRFNATSPSPCFNEHTFTFENNSYWIKDSIQQFTWRFEGGEDFTGPVPSAYAFDSFSNEKWIRLVAQTTIGCIDSNQIVVTLTPSPTVSLQVTDSAQCLMGNKFDAQLEASISAGTLRPQINWQGGLKDTLWNAQHTFDTSGFFKIVGRVISEKGCEALDTQTIEVFPQPVADFEVNDSSQCVQNQFFKFTNSAHAIGGEFTHTWESINGVSNTFNYEPTFQGSGREWVKLSVISLQGCVDSMVKWVNINPVPVAMVESILDSQCLKGNQFVWENKSLGSEEGRSFWAIPTLNVKDSTVNNKWTYSFNHAGVYDLVLITENQFDCRDTIATSVKVHPHPIAKFSASSVVCSGSEFTVVNESETTGGKTEFTWFINENIIDGLELKPVVFNGVETFNVRLKAVNEWGCTHDTVFKVEVMPKSFAEIKTFTEMPCANNNTFELALVSKNENIRLIQNKWQWEDGVEVEGDRISRKRLAPGVHTVKVHTLNNMGCKDTLEKQVEVLAKINLNANANTVCIPQANQFTGLSRATHDNITKEIWQVAGQEFYGSVAKKFLRTPGTYDIIYMVQTAKGCRDTLYINGGVTLKAKPKAAFELDSFYSEGMGMSLVLKNKSSKDVDQWGWSFNDWEFSADEHPTFLFTDTGVVNMTLIVGNSAGCYDTAFQEMGPYFPIFYLHIPNAFTPNGDDVNQNFKPVINNYLMKYNFEIYNRWGELLFTTEDPNAAWDGTFNGKPVQEGVYVYILYATDLLGNFHKEKGDVTLLRSN